MPWGGLLPDAGSPRNDEVLDHQIFPPLYRPCRPVGPARLGLPAIERHPFTGPHADSSGVPNTIGHRVAKADGPSSGELCAGCCAFVLARVPVVQALGRETTVGAARARCAGWLRVAGAAGAESNAPPFPPPRRACPPPPPPSRPRPGLAAPDCLCRHLAISKPMTPS